MQFCCRRCSSNFIIEEHQLSFILCYHPLYPMEIATRTDNIYKSICNRIYLISFHRWKLQFCNIAEHDVSTILVSGKE